MSIFLLFLRILTTKNYLNYIKNVEENKYYSSIINIIIKKINENKFDNLIYLINLFCPNSIINKIELIKDLNIYLNNLFKESFENLKKYSELFYQFVENKINELYEKVFNNSFIEIFKNSIKSNELIDFLFQPEEHIKKNIDDLKKKEIKKKYEEIINEKNNIINLFKNLKKIILIN